MRFWSLTGSVDECAAAIFRAPGKDHFLKPKDPARDACQFAGEVTATQSVLDAR